MSAHVVIVGAGFGGLNAARKLARAGVQVTIVDRQNFHLFQPLLYQVATAGLSAGDIATPIRALFAKQRNVNVVMSEVSAIDLASKRVRLKESELGYDQLILAAGVSHAYFGRDDWEKYAPGLKTVNDALEVRRRVLLAFEQAELEQGSPALGSWLTFVVVGAGPTGVELAGAISEFARFTVRREYRTFDPRTARVILIEAGPRVLAGFSEDLSLKAKASLEKLGVEVRLNARVTNVDCDGVQLGSERLSARTVLWAAGVVASPLSKSLGVELDRLGRVKVEADLTIPGYPDAYVIGDLAHFDLGNGQALPGLAPVAMQQGTHAAENILATLDGQSRTRFHYRDKGIMATIGRASGIAQRGDFKMWGFLGWAAWLFVHLVFLVGFRNRVLVLIQWAWHWLTYSRSARLITGTSALPCADLEVQKSSDERERPGLVPGRSAHPTH